MIRADYLFLLTDVDGLYTSNPRKDPDAKQIKVVSSIAAIRAMVSTTTLGSSLGTGGMETKLIAAEIATAAGVKTIITSSKDPRTVIKIIEYDMLAKNGVLPDPSSDTSPTERPPHTLFLASTEPMRDLKSWTRHTLNPSGSVIVDAGAHHVLSKRESGGRLLAVGVIGVIGAFAAQQAVRIVVRRRKVDEEEREEEKKRYLNALEPTRPGTPTRQGTAPEGVVVADEGRREDVDSTEKNRRSDADLQEEDVIEVGRGLANYNSAQILAVKGLHRYGLAI
jgi:glutamate 5-kinase